MRYGLYDGQDHHDEAERIVAGGAETNEGAAQAHALLAIHGELQAIRALAADTIQRVMGSRPGVTVERTRADGVRTRETLSAEELRSPERRSFRDAYEAIQSDIRRGSTS